MHLNMFNSIFNLPLISFFLIILQNSNTTSVPILILSSSYQTQLLSNSSNLYSNPLPHYLFLFYLTTFAYTVLQLFLNLRLAPDKQSFTFTNNSSIPIIFLFAGLVMSETEKVTAGKVYNWFANRRKDDKRRRTIGE